MGKNRIRVAVAMSGGVDSSLACALLVDRGFDVVGFTMKLLANPPSYLDPAARPCCTLEMTEDAKKICYLLGIPHYTINLVDEFEEEVIHPFIEEYVRGRTPNPCLWCNSKMKFGHLLKKAREIGAQYLATGHYVRSGRFTPEGEFVENYDAYEDPRESRTLLLRGKDRFKDQSYALYDLSQDMLSCSMFPLGRLTKKRVRELAREKGLVTAEKPESQEICFVTAGNYRTFLEERGVKPEPGFIRDTSGRILGRHHGIPFYTVGQRKGLGISAPEPLYVVAIDPEANEIIVGRREEAYSVGAYVENLNLIARSSLGGPVRGTCMVRYRGKEVPATMMEDEAGKETGVSSRALVKFDEPQFAVTPGQALVFFQGEVVFGGGIISRPARP